MSDKSNTMADDEVRKTLIQALGWRVEAGPNGIGSILITPDGKDCGCSSGDVDSFWEDRIEYHRRSSDPLTDANALLAVERKVFSINEFWPAGRFSLWLGYKQAIFEMLEMKPRDMIICEAATFSAPTATKARALADVLLALAIKERGE
ncbi:hypothetical protein KS4_23580 [Poriferisphaera corsica]|uniref:Uncharacterized protein n=1 Tax=Poriferisphaera corsica TaxID=2528020 RepID=A0A517YVN1_9BACT|nr:hypothetical protein [Poriferisphaera corsica]QDU34291.1 hypothetical protein KS4_23580 [Poriferisphaera corsica]